MQLFDAHCHLQDERLAPDLDAVMERAYRAGVTRFLCCGAAESDWDRVAGLSRQFKGMIPAFGLHPWYVKDRTARWLERLRDLLLTHPEAAVGEIGLDHALKEYSRTEQTEVFRDQIALAVELQRPVNLHCRRAWGALLEELRRCPTLPRGFMVHSYSGSTETLAPLLELGGYISFSGSITLSGNRRGHAAAQAVPLERLLIETDTPDIPPVIDGVRRTDVPNEPANLPLVAHRIARLRNLPMEQIAGETFYNAERLFPGLQWNERDRNSSAAAIQEGS